MTNHARDDEQDFHLFLDQYISEYPHDVMLVKEEVSAEEDVTAVVSLLTSQLRDPIVYFEKVKGFETQVVANVFGSRLRVGRMLGVEPSEIHEAYQQKSRNACEPIEVSTGPVLDRVEQSSIDLKKLPLLKHFETDRAPYITNSIIVSEDRSSNIGNLSYHRAMVHSSTELATSLHSRGHLWRMLQQSDGKPLPVALIIGVHPLFMLAASARVPFGMDERHIAGGLLGEPLKVVRTPNYGIGVPACAEFVLEGFIDPTQNVEEGPFGEFTGYSSDRSTNNLLRVETLMSRKNALLIDVMGGDSAEHLNLGRIPRESEMVEKLKERFPGVTAVHYPKSGTHFHAYVALRQMRQGEARQIMTGLLGWDPYLKTVIAVDEDIDITNDSEVLWALSTHFQPHRDIVIIDGLPGSALDPSASGEGTTSRMGLDATRGESFEGIRATVSKKAMERAAEILDNLLS